jgi:hypothetical protein
MVSVADENSKYNPIPGANNREDCALQFEFLQFWPLEADHETDSKPPVDRQTIVQQIENIIVGYGANELFPLLRRPPKLSHRSSAKTIGCWKHGQTSFTICMDRSREISNPTKKRRISQVKLTKSRERVKH